MTSTENHTPLTWTRYTDGRSFWDEADGPFEPVDGTCYVIRKSGPKSWTLEFPDAVGPEATFSTRREAREAAQLHADHSHGDLVEASVALDADVVLARPGDAEPSSIPDVIASSVVDDDSASSAPDGFTDAQVLAALTDLAWAEVIARQRIEQLVNYARSRGLTWYQIGEAAGTTKQGASARFGKHVYKDTRYVPTDALGPGRVTFYTGMRPRSPRGKNIR